MYTLEHKNSKFITNLFNKGGYADFEALKDDLSMFNQLVLKDCNENEASILNDYLFEDEKAIDFINKKTDFLIKSI